MASFKSKDSFDFCRCDRGHEGQLTWTYWEKVHSLSFEIIMRLQQLNLSNTDRAKCPYYRGHHYDVTFDFIDSLKYLVTRNVLQRNAAGKKLTLSTNPKTSKMNKASRWYFFVTRNRKLHYEHKISSPDHRSVRNKEVKFIWICSLGPGFSVRCPY